MPASRAAEWSWPSLRLHSYGVPIGNGEKPTLQLSKRLKTRLSKHTRAATFEPSKAGLLSLQTLNLSEEMSGKKKSQLVPLALQHQSEVGCEALSSDVMNFELLLIILSIILLHSF